MTELRQRQPRETAPGFLAFVRRLRCCACYAPAPSEAAHIRIGSREHHKRPTGIGEKPSDRWAVPLCNGCHQSDPGAQHQVGEESFWARLGLDPFAIATALYGEYSAARPASEPGAKIKRQKRKGVRPLKCAHPKVKIPSRKNPWPKGRKIRRRD